VEANEPSLALRRTRLTFLYTLKLKSNIHNPTYECTFSPQYQSLFQRKPNTIPTFGIRALKLLQDSSIDISTIASYTLPPVPPWLCKMPIICLSLHTGNKAVSNPSILKQSFYQLLSVYTGYTQIYTDGSKEGSSVAAAMVLRHNMVMTARLPDNSSIYSAESHAILMALEFIERDDSSQFVIFSDSLSVLQAINNAKWSSPLVCNILEKCHFVACSGKEIHFCWVPSHVGITGNERADAEAKGALRFPASDCMVPHTDYKQVITSNLRKLWQSQWDQVLFNKLQPIKKTLGDTRFKGISKRRDELVLHRARIGHTHLTHCYLLKAEEQPQCVSCQRALSVQHILIDCPHYESSRGKFFKVSSMGELFNNIPASVLLNFLREIHVYQHF